MPTTISPVIEPSGSQGGPPSPDGPIRPQITRLLAIVLVTAVVAGAVAAGGTVLGLRLLSRSVQQVVSPGTRVTITEDSAAASVAAESADAMVEILPQGAQGPAGSGFLISADGYVVTAVQNIANASSLTVLLATGGARQARLIDYDCQSGVAVLKVDQASNLASLSFGSSDSLKLGQTLISLGGAASQLTVSHGIVSSLHQFVSIPNPIGAGPGLEVGDTFSSDARSLPLNSGGPVLNVAGQVVGITAWAAVTPASVSFAVAADDVSAEVAQIVSAGQLAVPGIGAQFVNLSSHQVTLNGGVTGARITSVVAAGPAARAGLLPGDEVVQLDAQQLDDAHPLALVLRRDYKPDQLVTVSYLRAGQTHQTQLTLDAEHPSC